MASSSSTDAEKDKSAVDSGFDVEDVGGSAEQKAQDLLLLAVPAENWPDNAKTEHMTGVAVEAFLDSAGLEHGEGLKPAQLKLLLARLSARAEVLRNVSKAKTRKRKRQEMEAHLEGESERERKRRKLEADAKAKFDAAALKPGSALVKALQAVSGGKPVRFETANGAYVLSPSGEVSATAAASKKTETVSGKDTGGKSQRFRLPLFDLGIDDALSGTQRGSKTQSADSSSVNDSKDGEKVRHIVLGRGSSSATTMQSHLNHNDKDATIKCATLKNVLQYAYDQCADPSLLHSAYEEAFNVSQQYDLRKNIDKMPIPSAGFFLSAFNVAYGVYEDCEITVKNKEEKRAEFKDLMTAICEDILCYTSATLTPLLRHVCEACTCSDGIFKTYEKARTRFALQMHRRVYNRHTTTRRRSEAPRRDHYKVHCCIDYNKNMCTRARCNFPHVCGHCGSRDHKAGACRPHR